MAWKKAETCKKITVVFDFTLPLFVIRHDCPSVRMEQLGSQWTDFHEIWNLSIFRNSVDKIEVLPKSDKNNAYFTWRPMYIFDHISLNSSQNEKCFRQML